MLLNERFTGGYRLSRSEGSSQQRRKLTEGGPGVSPKLAKCVSPQRVCRQLAHTVGVRWQYTVTAGRIEHAQVGPNWSCGHGRNSDRPGAYLPKSWTAVPERCRATEVPDATTFSTKPALARDHRPGIRCRRHRLASTGELAFYRCYTSTRRHRPSWSLLDNPRHSLPPHPRRSSPRPNELRSARHPA